ncbi:hypothetical protein ABW21_db0207012 [Orbilia brochopaga]|nr:hypothetical protein ABW21_db0207012 [Drechslerella brochopaga]
MQHTKFDRDHQHPESISISSMSPAAMEDPYAPRKYLSGPTRANYHPERILPFSTTLKDGTKVRVTPFINGYHEPPAHSAVELLCREMNGEIEAGDTYPMDEGMDVVAFKGYWFGSFAAVVMLERNGSDGSSSEMGEVLGSFHVKPNYPVNMSEAHERA